MLLVLAGAVAGCAGYTLMPTPNLYLAGSGYPSDRIPPALRSSHVELFYITDRARQPQQAPHRVYGSQRSKSLAFGSARVGIGSDAIWEELVAASGARNRQRRLRLRLQEVHELGRFPETPAPFHVVDGVIVDDPEAVEAERIAGERFRAELERRLDATGVREAILFVHGFNTTFEKAALLHAEVWHFLGRWGVPIVYSWPAASGGALGYVSDRESGEFTVFHLKQVLRQLAATRGLERIHILAHSRGTDVATSALRELVIETRAAGRDPLEVFRIANLVLAAPDLDFGTVGQRLIAERFGPAFGRITIYTAQTDRALDVSELLFGGVRFGRVQTKDLGERERKIFRAVGNVHIVEVRGATDTFRHEYFHSSPEASTDLVLVLRDGLEPGTPDRPLIHEQGNFWSIPRGYRLEERGE